MADTLTQVKNALEHKAPVVSLTALQAEQFVALATAVQAADQAATQAALEELVKPEQEPASGDAMGVPGAHFAGPADLTITDTTMGSTPQA
jgi:hypothetical protein